MGALHDDPLLIANVEAILAALKPEVVIETGTFRGTTTEWFAQRVPVVLTCEIREDFADAAEARFREAKLKNITIFRGPSQHRIGAMLMAARDLGGACLVYLDAHWQDDWPLMAELIACFRARGQLFNGFLAVIIDDFQVPGRTGFSAPDGGGGTVGDAMYGPKSVQGGIPADLRHFWPVLESWALRFPAYDGPAIGYAIALGAGALRAVEEAGGLPYAELPRGGPPQ